MEYRTPQELSFSGNVAQNWKEWYQQFNIYLIASNKDEESDIRKTNILLNLIGPQGVKIYNNFKKKEKTNFDTVVQAFTQYCEPRKNIIFQRYKFGCCIQQEGQSFDDFLTELKTLAATCEYKEEDNMIRDRIVFGVKDPGIKDKLLTISNLTLDKSEEICKTTVVTKQELQEMTTSSEIHFLKSRSTGNRKEKFNPQQQKKQVSDFLVRPFFDTTVSSNITTQLGGHAYMPCRVKQLGNKSVSWIRRRDSHILTIDWLLFIADDRFRIFLVEPTCTWTLQIKYVQPRDAGTYECQINTSPKMSHMVQLNVVVPKIEIMGESDIHVMEGSSVSLKCVIRQSVRDPDYIFWYQNNKRVLDYGKGAKVISNERVDANTMVATLTINNAVLHDSGNYTCQPSNLDSASAYLHVLNGEHPAAIQRGHSSGTQIPIRLLGPLSAVLGLSSSHSTRAALLTTAFAVDLAVRVLYSMIV